MTKMMTCLIIDDEPSAQQILEQYVDDCPSLQLSGVCDDALDALEFLKHSSVDLLFLDLNMPRLSGISFLKSLNNPPAAILTTGYDDFALEGYELDVVDYLLKPFSFERFLKAVTKAEERVHTTQSEGDPLYIKADGKIYRMDPEELLFIESMGDYVTFHSEDQKLISYDTLKNLEKVLPADRFVRVHKSYIVSLSKVDYLEGNQLKLGPQKIPIGKTYQVKVKELFS